MQPTETKARRSAAGAVAATRVLSGLIAVLVFIQGALAGSYLSGAGGVIDIHGMMGTIALPLLALTTIVTAAVATRRNRWVLAGSIFGFLGIGTQIGMGYQSRLDVHVPLGIALFGLYLVMALAVRDRNTTEG
ncbi:MAG TPA: hypothetical protein VHL52_13920 [Acidimicrobiia bacterium]|nr:hypothetical protein [Acidimicrobiia bacterium]